jgi:hypothetical protein
MSQEIGAEPSADSLLPIRVTGVVLTRKERRVVWTPWRAFDIARLSFSVLIQIAAVPFWIAAALLHFPQPAFLVMILVGVGYGCVYIVLRRIVGRLSKTSALEGPPVDWFIDSSGVRRVSPMFDFYIGREGFASFGEDNRRFLFFTSSQVCIVLPKRCLDAAQDGALRSLIATWR